MRIGINALYWLPDSMGGTQTYFLNLVQHLVEAAPEDHFVLFLNKDAASRYRLRAPNLTVHTCPVSGRNRMLRLIWENVVLPREALRYDLDLMHSFGYISPPLLSIPSVATVLDMIHFVRPEDIAPAKRFLWKLLFPLSLRKVSRVITISQSVKDDLLSFFPWAETKTTPIHLGVQHNMFVEKNMLETSHSDLIVKPPYILAVSSLGRHKNLDSTIQAFSTIASELPDLRLVLVGMKSTASEKLMALSIRSGLADRIEFTGRIPDSQLVALYQNASVFIYPSLYEGFGLPILEAMACGCPVIASNRYSVPEVAGSAALLVDPTNISQIASSILRLINSQELRNEMVQAGLRRSALFTWTRTAQESLNVYHAYSNC